MIRETRELLAALKRMNEKVPEVAVAIAGESLTVEEQTEFGGLLIELGEAVLEHARTERAAVIESEGMGEVERDERTSGD